MVTAPVPAGHRKKRPYRKSHFGCRNCKLRRVKCDESKPQCQKCLDYGVSCNFFGAAPDLQISAGSQGRRIAGAGRVQSNPLAAPLVGRSVVCSDGVAMFEMSAECMARFERFRNSTIGTIMKPEMAKIWKEQIPKIAFANPYLMHTMLALAATHERYRDMPPGSHQTGSETHHLTQCAILFNQKLSRPMGPEDRDPLWATAALLSIMSFSRFDAATPEEAWPLRPPDTQDLEWLRLSEGKQTIWKLTDPLRPGGLFRAMADVYAQLHFPLPESGTEGIPQALMKLCGLDSESNMENPYFAPAHVLAQLQWLPDSEATLTKILAFVSQSSPSFKTLLREKDPVALLLLALWYQRAARVIWWIEKRAPVESAAIRLYLERFHSNDERLSELLPLLPSSP